MVENDHTNDEWILNWGKSLFQDTPDLVFIKNLDLIYVAASRAFVNMLGRTGTEEIIGHTDFDLFQDQLLAQRYVEDDKRILSTGKPLDAYVEPLPKKGGKPVWCLARKGLVHDDDGRVVGVYGFSSDITALKTENGRIRTILAELTPSSEQDSMTQLLNRRATVDKIKAYLGGDGTCKKHALLLIDLPRFESANDQFGYPHGNERLISVARSIASLFQSSDIVGRMDGATFLVLMKDISSLKAVRAKAADLICAIQLWVEEDDVMANASSSVGISLSNGNGASFDELYAEAEDALFHAKALGKNHFFIWEDRNLQNESAQKKTPSAFTENNTQVVCQRQSILIADNDPNSRTLLQNVLEHNYSVEFASDGVDALETLKGRPFSLLITDIQMPRMTGWDLLSAMQKDEALRDIPVIVITADYQVQSEIRALNLGVTDVIAKPFSAVTLMPRVQNTIARREIRLKEEQNRLYEVRLQQQEELLRLAEQDELTGLCNRKSFIRKAGALIRPNPSGSYVLSCLNVDGFTAINDRYGHAEGDHLLEYIAHDVLQRIYGEALLICRDVADIFLVLLPNNAEMLAAADQDILTAVMQYPLPTTVCVSIGQYVVTEPKIDVSLMIDRAKIAQSTVQGNTQTHVAWYDDSMREKMLRTQALIDQMRSSLASEEFEVWFQPQYEYPSGHLYGAEALVRWQHPEMGLISPGEFIPLFEKNGFIRELDQYVWVKTCQLMKAWAEKNGGDLPVPISVNISRADVYDPALTEILMGLAREHNLPPSCLRLEITESAYMNDPMQLIDTVKKLRQAGFTVEIDDFGSGYSSLNTLKDVVVDVLKLDMRFLSAGTDNFVGNRILGFIIQMADSIGREVIAEGVETQEHAELLHSLGCRYMQGYFFSRPLPAKQFEVLLFQAP